jgi:deoxyribodipyrimidine photo-lyase
MTKNALVWFRQDLRCTDNPALSSACNSSQIVIPIYIYDFQNILSLGSAQKWWLHNSLLSLETNLRAIGLHLVIRQGDPFTCLSELIQQNQIDTVYWNRCYEPAAIKRDISIKKTLKEHGIFVNTSNSTLLNEPWTIQNKSGHYFKVFTPFWKHCLQKTVIPAPNIISKQPLSPSISSDSIDSLNLLPTKPNWAAEFQNYWCPGENGAQKKLQDFIRYQLNTYKEARNEPAKNATSLLSPHLHFGEISPQQILRSVEQAKLNKNCNLASIEHFLSEIGWREFSYHLLYHFPELPSRNFKSAFDNFPWKMDKVLLAHWQTGTTGYPIVDAGMRELWQTGYMHNRVRMIAASFLIKDLLIDWRIGASWFLDTLLDADMASNSASWQWVAGSGADAAPYFRIFNPILQGEKFDPNGEYIRRWVPELSGLPNKWIHQPWCAPSEGAKFVLGKDYPHPIVKHDEARILALAHYKKLLVVRSIRT